MNTKSRARHAYMFIAPFFIVFLIFSLYPIIYSLQLSFYDLDPLSGAAKWVGISNYERLFKSPFFLRSFYNTFIIWIMSIIPQLTIAFVLSLMLNNKWLKGRALFRNLFYFPNLVTPVTIGLLFGAMFSYPGGTVNQIMGLLEISPIDFQNKPFLAQMVISMAICWRNFGYNIIFFTAGLNSISTEIYEAAEVDGANAFTKGTRITIPLMRPILVYVMVTSIIGGLQIFDESKLVFKTVPGDATTTMVKYMYESAFERSQFGYGAACAFGIFIVIAIFSIISLLVTREKKEA